MKKAINLISFNLESLTKKSLKKFKNERNLFLIGNWCRNDKEFKDNKDFKSLNFYKWNSKEKKSNDINKIIEIYEKLLHHISNNLNKIHNKNYSKKYWEFLLNRWLMAYVVEVYSKWQISEKLIKNYKINNFYFINLNEKKFIPENTYHHNRLHKMLNGYWSHIFFRKILNYRLDNLKEKEISFFKFKKKYFEYNVKKYNTLKLKILNFSFLKKIILYKISFDKKIILLLKLKNFFFNFFIKNFRSRLNNKSLILRSDFTKLFPKQINSLENFMLENIHLSFPKIFLENYNSLEHSYSNLKWPKNPDFILTTYGHYYDELFKIYCAKNIIKNTKLYIFQHGDGGIFTDNDFYNTGWDKKICDKFFAWGKNQKNGYRNFYYTKKCINKKSHFLPVNGGKILSIMYGFNEQPYRPLNGFTDSYEINKGLILSNVKFCHKLSNNIKNIIDFKLLDDSKDEKVKFSLKKKFKNNKIIEKNKNYLKILNEYNLVIHFFLGTPFFESMLSNRPSIVILNKRFQFHFDNNFEKYIKKFLKLNIVFESSNEASLFVNRNFNNIANWWNSRKIQKIRNEFCDMYCRRFETKKDFNNLFKK